MTESLIQGQQVVFSLDIQKDSKATDFIAQQNTWKIVEISHAKCLEDGDSYGSTENWKDSFSKISKSTSLLQWRQIIWTIQNRYVLSPLYMYLKIKNKL